MNSELPIAESQAKSGVSVNQLGILRHSLGLDHAGHGRMYRDHYCVGIDHESATLEEIRDLVRRGLMVAGAKINRDTDQIFHVTEAGKQVARSVEPPKKVSRGAWRYQEFLDADSGMTFRDWLKGLKHREQRREVCS